MGELPKMRADILLSGVGERVVNVVGFVDAE
jgi:hypothetical protein